MYVINSYYLVLLLVITQNLLRSGFPYRVYFISFGSHPRNETEEKEVAFHAISFLFASTYNICYLSMFRHSICPLGHQFCRQMSRWTYTRLLKCLYYNIMEISFSTALIIIFASLERNVNVQPVST